MPNHFHLLVFQHNLKAITGLMRCVMTSYSRYFNSKYERSGPLFESRYKSSLISNDTYLMHISRYIHLNPRDYRNWEWSSLPYYLRGWKAEWIHPDKILGLFHSVRKYDEFVQDYESAKEIIDSIKYELADR